MAENIAFDFDLVITKGDDRETPFEFYQEDGVTDLDVTTWSFFYTAKSTVTDTDADAAITKDPLDLAPYDTNKMKLILSKTDTILTPGEYIHEIQAINSLGVQTIAVGSLTIEAQVTIREVAL